MAEWTDEELEAIAEASPVTNLDLSTFGYARVSTRAQDPLGQVEALRGAGCCRIYTDVATGTTVHDRAALAELLGHLRRGDQLVVVRLDRLARSLRELLELAAALQARGVGLRSLREDLDTRSASGRLLFHVLGALGEFEGNLRRERQQEAWEAGRQKGRPRTMTFDQIETARRLRREGRSYAAIARSVGAPRSNVQRALVDQEGSELCE